MTFSNKLYACKIKQDILHRSTCEKSKGRILDVLLFHAMGSVVAKHNHCHSNKRSNVSSEFML